ncbi:MAG: metallopeptidase TldD-related protein [Thermoanaerobaculum sp.]
MDGFSPLADLVARSRKPDRELFFWQELRVAFEARERKAVRVAARLREAVSVRDEKALAAMDGCSREQVAALLSVKPKSVPAFSWDGELQVPEPSALATQLPSLPLTVGVTTSRVVVVRGDGVFAATRPVVVDATNNAGETFSWVWGQPVPPMAEATAGKAAPPSGRFRALLRPQPAAVLCHELFGHPLEADVFFSGQSPWAGKLGTRVTAAPLTVVDDPQAQLPGGFSADDEGEPGRPKALLNGGVLAGVLADRSYGALAVKAGNARRASPHHPPLPRLSNLLSWVEGGDPTPPLGEATVEIVRVRSGAVLPGENAAVLAVSESYTLSRGRRKAHLAPFFLRLPLAADGIVGGGGNPEPVAEPGWCHKGRQLLPVGAAASWLLLAGVEVA